MAGKADTDIYEAEVDKYKCEIPLDSISDCYCVEELLSDNEEDEEEALAESTTPSDCFNNDGYLTGWQEERKAGMYEGYKIAGAEGGDIEPWKVLYPKMYATGKLPRKMPVKITINYEKLSRPWKIAVEKGIQDIELVAPGLCFSQDTSLSADIFVTMVDDITKTIGSLRFPKVDERNKVKIVLTKNYSSTRRKGTAIHELLHALGLEHEHQRHDSGHYLKLCSYSHQEMVKHKYFVPLTPFDPYSVMFYKIGHYFYHKGDEKENRVYSENRHMSQLDKIALNMLYPPSETSDYKPVKASHGMYYCGRSFVMGNHNQPYPPLVDQCGPDNGPNCAACRVLSKPNNLGKRWQGRSNYVYCEKEFCGPHVNAPCDDCLEFVGEICQQ